MKRSKILRKFFLANMAMFSVSILILATISIIDIVQLQSQADLANEQQVNRMVHDLELRLLEMHRIVENFRSFPELRSHAINSSIDYPHRIATQLQKLKFPAMHLKSLGICYRNSLHEDINFTIFTTIGAMTVGEYARLQCAGGISEQDLYEEIRNISAVTFIFNYEIGGNQNFLLMACPLNNDTHMYSGFLLFNIDMPTLMNEIYPDRRPDDSLFITDDRGRILFSVNTYDTDLDSCNSCAFRYLGPGGRCRR